MLRLAGIWKQFQDQWIVNGVSLAVRAGELITILGPSGCGKTTLLRLVAGLLTPERGQIWLGDRLLTDAARRVHEPAERRGVGLVFQDYALWPHLTIAQHIAFALELRRVRGRAAAERTQELLRLVQLDGLAERAPGQLSGGQQQRVALARALAADARLLLLDEPLSNLDARLRQAMRNELRTLIRSTGLTAIAVTHDQADALAISDRIVVMSAGRILQQGTPQEVFERPASSTVAHFLGAGAIVPGEVMSDADTGLAAAGLSLFRPRGGSAAFLAASALKTGASRPLVAVIPSHTGLPSMHPGQAALAPAAEPDQSLISDAAPLTTLTGRVVACYYIGRGWELEVELPGGHRVQRLGPDPVSPGDFVTWQLPSRAIRLTPDDADASA